MTKESVGFDGVAYMYPWNMDARGCIRYILKITCHDLGFSLDLIRLSAHGMCFNPNHWRPVCEEVWKLIKIHGKFHMRLAIRFAEGTHPKKNEHIPGSLSSGFSGEKTDKLSNSSTHRLGKFKRCLGSSHQNLRLL